MIEKLETALEWGGTAKEITLLIIGAAAVIASLVGFDPLPFDSAWIAIVLCGVPILCEAAIGLITEFDIKADVLVSLALIASVAIGEYFAAGEVAVIMQLGALLESLTVAKARSGIERLVSITPRTARIVSGGTENVVPAEKVQVNNVVRVLPGETVPVDGVIVSGSTAIDQSVMTGESLPVDKQPGDEVQSGTVNQFGAFEMRATKVGEDSSISRMVRLVESADAGKAKIVRLADRWATWIVVIALASAIITWAVTGEIIRAVTILVVFCPCALVLATPTAIMAAIGNVTRRGILVREGDALERLAQVHRIMFDKTGTLTEGVLRVVAVEDARTGKVVQGEGDGAVGGFSPDNEAAVLFSQIAAIEAKSEHPLGRAVAQGYVKRFGRTPVEADNFQMKPGLGVEGDVQGIHIAVGNARMMRSSGVLEFSEKTAGPYSERGCTVSFIAVDGMYRGIVALADTVRKTAAQTLEALRKQGISTIMATGDDVRAASAIARSTGVDEVRAECTPEDKLSAIEELEKRGENVCMVGDGVNDAPSLKRAYVGVAMGGVGSDIAVDAADIVLVSDEVEALPHAVALSRRMMTTIKPNLTFSLTLNFVAIVLAITGVMGPVVGALVHNCGSVLVIANSALLLKWKMRD